MNGYKIGVIRSDIGEQLLLKGGIQTENIDAVAQTIQNIKKLVAWRVDLVAYGDAPFKWEIKQHGYNPEDFETIFNLSKGELSFAFHKDTSDAVIQKFQKTLDEVKSPPLRVGY